MLLIKFWSISKRFISTLEGRMALLLQISKVVFHLIILTCQNIAKFRITQNYTGPGT